MKGRGLSWIVAFVVLTAAVIIGGAEGSRTPDPKTASLVLSQLSYSPTRGITVQGGRRSCQGSEWWGRGDSNP